MIISLPRGSPLPLGLGEMYSVTLGLWKLCKSRLSLITHHLPSSSTCSLHLAPTSFPSSPATWATPWLSIISKLHRHQPSVLSPRSFRPYFSHSSPSPPNLLHSFCHGLTNHLLPLPHTPINQNISTSRLLFPPLSLAKREASESGIQRKKGFFFPRVTEHCGLS